VASFRYIALIWSEENEAQNHCAHALSRQLQASRSRSWSVGLSRSGLTVFHTGSRYPGPVKCYLLPNDAGLILGTLFLRDDPRSAEAAAARAFTCDAAQGAHILSSRGRWLIHSSWGRYVALFHDPTGQTFRVLRDPSGTLPCLITTFEGLLVVFSHPEDLILLGALKPAINWPYIRAHATHPQLNGRQTAIHGVSEICAGECLSWSGKQMSRELFWSPAGFVRSGLQTEAPSQCVGEIHSTLKSCVHSWAAGHDSILHRLSGGLDSSVVLSCLRSAPNHPTLTAINCFSDDPIGDERVYARAAAMHARCPLVELRMEAELDLQRILTLERSARPGHYFTGLQTAPHESQLARQLQATAIFGGGWGDQLFYRTRNDSAAADYIADHGWSLEWLTTARDAAELSRTTVWRVLGRLLRNRLLHRPWDPFPKHSHTDTFVRPDVDASSCDAEVLLHPWFEDSAGLPFGKLWHILLLSAPADFRRPVAEDDDPEPIEPLRSQPLMELCLGIPTYVLTRGAGDRLLVRTAFERELPPLVLKRLSKGFVDQGFQSVVRHNVRFVRELMLEGGLVKEKILDRPKLERALSDGFLHGGPPQAELFAHICTEAWLRVWQAT